MASPTYAHNLFSQTSPPYPPNAQLPQSQKRRQPEMSSSAPGVKRRKMSMLSQNSTSSHPLRQTSFPPENANAIIGTPRSPSVDTMSLASTSVVGGPKKKRGRKPKANDDGESAVGGKAKSAVSGTSGGRKRKNSVVSADEEEEDGGEEMAVEMVARSAEEKQKEVEHRAMLVNALDPEQMERYTAWRSSKLSDAVTRRIVNQTLSQSAPAQVILAIRSVAKLFAGDIIEGARKVQAQWNERDEMLKEEIKKKMQEMLTPPTDIPAEVMDEVKKLPVGPLEPDHLREAHRRYKLAREGGLAGQMGLWHTQHQSGVERFATKARGKTLFK